MRYDVTISIAIAIPISGRESVGMLLTEVNFKDGTHRVYLTRVNSVIAWFEEDDSGHIVAHAEYGEFACPYNRGTDKLEAMIDCLVGEAARRLNIQPAQVGHCTLSDIVAVCDPPLTEKCDWTGRMRGVQRISR